MFCNSTITDLFLFVFTQLILHYQIELSRIICYTDDIIQECLVEQLLERTDNYYNVSSFGSAFLKSINLENSSWKKIDSEFKINGEQKEEFKFNFLS